jgi:hypothetical protein
MNVQKRNHVVAYLPPWANTSPPPSTSWCDYQPSNKRILVRDVSSFGGGIEGWAKFIEEYPAARGYIIAWLPGYSKDKKTAILHFSIGPSAHGGVGTYLLVNARNKWKIKWHNIQNFL